MKSVTLQVMDETMTAYADVLLKVMKIVDSLTDEINALRDRVQVLENER